MDVVEFLLARIDEDERATRSWSRGVLAPDASAIEKRWQVDRVLAECDAKRRIMKDHKHAPETQGCGCDMHGDLVTFMGCDVCVSDTQYVDSGGWCLTLRALALPYAEHEDYRQEWSPAYTPAYLG